MHRPLVVAACSSLFLVSFATLLLTACTGRLSRPGEGSSLEQSSASTTESDQVPPAADIDVPKNYRLQEDRSAFDEIRQDISTEKKIENDELAVMLNLFSNPYDTPSKIRNKFNALIRKKRKAFDRKLKDERKAFNTEEKATRDEFLKDLKEQIKYFTVRRFSADERKKKLADIEVKRKAFFEDQKIRRGDFEEQKRAERANFEDYVRQKNSEFQQEMRNYEAEKRLRKKNGGE